MSERIISEKVPVNFGKLLENQLKRWEGGGHHPSGIAEYISNSGDSYGRQKRLYGERIIIELHSRTGKKIDKLIVQDYAEGMSYEDLENKFFQYFESFSGREKGEKVTGRFGTGGKAYAIMNFRHCWIISIQNNYECKAWFKWDSINKEIIKGYNNGGYKNKFTNDINGTRVILESSIKVNYPLQDFIIYLEKLARIRHILKSQNVIFKIYRRGSIEEVTLKYTEPKPSEALRHWTFMLPSNLKNDNGFSNELLIRFYEKPLGENAFIDLNDGISSVADLNVSNYDGRPFSKYLNGNMTLTKLIDSSAVKENRRGLEEGDDLTEEIESFITESVKKVINEVEEFQKNLDKEKRINAANEKLNELSKFLSKQDLKFKLELNELKKRFSKYDDISFPEIEEEKDDENKQDIYRKPVPEDAIEDLIKGKWINKTEEGGDGPPSPIRIEFVPDEKGDDLAVKVGKKRKTSAQPIKQKKGLQVLMSNDSSNPDSPTFKEYDEPVSDRDMLSKGIIWINAVHPIIVKFGNEKTKDDIRNENIANYVLMIVAQFYAQKEAELQPEDERDDLMLLFRKHFFKLQMEIRLDKEISYFDKHE
jgi:hypothetical protein